MPKFEFKRMHLRLIVFVMFTPFIFNMGAYAIYHFEGLNGGVADFTLASRTI